MHAVAGIVQVHVAGDDALELRLRVVEIILAAPEGVVGIEADQSDAASGLRVHACSLPARKR